MISDPVDAALIALVSREIAWKLRQDVDTARSLLGWAANVWVLVGSLQEAVTEEQIHALIGYILREIDTLPQRTQLLEHMAIALRTQALWFAIHGEANHAGQALLLARGLRALPLRQNPLLAGLLRAGYMQRSSSSSS